LAQLLVLVFAPLLALITLAEPMPGRASVGAEPLTLAARLWIGQVGGSVAVRAWGRPEIALVAAIHDGKGGARVELEVRQAAHGLEIAVRIPKQSNLLGIHRAPHCELMIKAPRPWAGKGTRPIGG